MARIFTAGNELAIPAREGFFGNGITYPAITQRGGYRTVEQNGGEYYYYLPQNYYLALYPGFVGEPASYPTGNAYTELLVRFHFNMSTGGVSGERAVFAFIGDDETRFFTVTVYDSGGSGTAGNPYGVRVRQDLSGTIWADTGAGPINNEWELIEVRLRLGAGGTGEVEIRVNEVSLASNSGTLTGPSAETTMAGFWIENTQISGSTRINFIDNIAVNDTTGTVNNSWPGQGYVVLRVPQREGSTTELTSDLGTSGADNASRIGIDDLFAPGENIDGSSNKALPTRSIDSDTQIAAESRTRRSGFVAPTAVPQKDTYTINELPFDAGAVRAISVFSEARSKTSSVGNIRHLLQPPAQAEIQGGAIALPSAAPDAQITHFSENPNTGLGFTAAEVNGLEIGAQFEA